MRLPNPWRDSRMKNEESPEGQGQGDGGQQQNVVWESAQNSDGTWKGGVYDHNKGEWEEGYEHGPGDPPPGGGSLQPGGQGAGWGRGSGWGR